jgi:epoxyqueuosine reductase
MNDPLRVAQVQDMDGRTLSPCPVERSYKLVSEGKVHWVSEDPPVIRLTRAVERPTPVAEAAPFTLTGQRLLLHICCAPCATYTVQHLRGLQAEVTGHWFNPNIHPYTEHEQRRATLARYAQEIALPVLWSQGYEMPAFLRAVCGHERLGERCAICYRCRLERTAQVAAEQGYDSFSTTLLISPYQDLALIRSLGEEMAQRFGVGFYFENLRRGFAEHYRLARAHELYMQRYCGCLYSEWEAHDRQAETRRG